MAARLRVAGAVLCWREQACQCASLDDARRKANTRKCPSLQARARVWLQARDRAEANVSAREGARAQVLRRTRAWVTGERAHARTGAGQVGARGAWPMA
eukprot:2498467-Pleurochrysis_carterae.AAC.1